MFLSTILICIILNFNRNICRKNSIHYKQVFNHEKALINVNDRCLKLDMFTIVYISYYFIGIYKNVV